MSKDTKEENKGTLNSQEEQQTANTQSESDVKAKDRKEKKEKSKKTTEKDKQIKEVEELQEKLNAQKERYIRLAAEYDNYRKRTANEKLSIYNDATSKAIEEILPVADSMQMAIQSLKDAPDEVKKGIELVSQQLDASFEKLNIQCFGEIGDNFDPEIHNAVSKIENEELGENQLSQVFQKGYKIGDKVIRHAMVQVANCS